MHMNRNALIHTLATIALTLITSAARAQFDVSPAVGPGNKIVTNAFHDDTETEIKNVRVFAYAFGEDETQPYFLSDPSFHPLPGISGFVGGSVIGFDLTAPLRFWSGTGSPSFAPVIAGDSIRFDFGASTVTSTGAGVPNPAGYGFGVIEPGGEFDDHLSTYLLAAAGTTAVLGLPTTGVYLATLSITTDQSGVLASDPVYLLFSNDPTDEALLGAAVYARDTFAPGSVLTVPEPATLGTIASAAVIMLRCRRGPARPSTVGR
jgi:hypothetical protein